MNYTTIQQLFSRQGLFSTHDVLKRFPHFDARRLIEWQQKGYIQRVVNRWYLFADTPRDERLLWWIANRIYQPSYLSVETALSFYGLIPEGVYTFTSVSSRKTQVIQTPVASFRYQHIKPTLYFGYQILRVPAASPFTDRPVLIAYPEKALLDFCYLNPHISSVDDFAGLRLNATLLRSLLNLERLENYLHLFQVKRLEQRIRVLYHYIDQQEECKN